MIGISLVEESNQLLKNVEGVRIEAILDSSISIKKFMYDQFDFDTNSFLDLIEYTDFQDFDDYMFVCLTKENRLEAIVNLLNKHSELTRFHYVSIDKDSNTSIVKYVDRNKLNLLKKEKDNSEVALRNGLFALFTGTYPNIFKKSIVKHIYIENKELIEKIDLSIFLNSAINHGVYVDQKTKSSSSLPGVIVYKDTLKTFKFNRDLQSLTNDELYEIIKNFIETGEITKKNHKYGIIDYDAMLSIESARRLFIRESGIYEDFGGTRKLTSKVDATFLEVQISKSSLEKKVQNNGLTQLLPMLISLTLELDEPKVKFVTPFNKRKLAEASTNEYQSNWLVFSKNNQFYAYNPTSNRMFQVNELFADIFEADIKNAVKEIKKINEFITDELVLEQKELMLNA